MVTQDLYLQSTVILSKDQEIKRSSMDILAVQSNSFPRYATLLYVYCLYCIVLYCIVEYTNPLSALVMIIFQHSRLVSAFQDKQAVTDDTVAGEEEDDITLT